jgi:ABC-type Fe3+-siderophore transport system permease subunit
MSNTSRWIWLGLGLTASAAIALYSGNPSSEVFTTLRIPRTLLAIGVGGALALAGCLLQAAFANPLCEPYTLGVSSGSSLGVALAASLGLANFGFGGVGFGAILGALAFAILIQAVAARRQANPSAILVCGAILGLAAASFVSVWMSLVESTIAQDSLWWLLGDLSRARAWTALILLAVVGIALLVALRDRKHFDALLLGDLQTRSFGYDPATSRQRAVLLSSFLVGASVSCAGVIGFVGLVSPHLARAFFKSALHARVMPAAVVLGGTMVALGDGLSRMIFPSFEVPVGAMTAILGAPFAIWTLLSHSSESRT